MDSLSRGRESCEVAIEITLIGRTKPRSVRRLHSVIQTVMSKSDLQHQVDGMLRRGIFFSIFWLMGVGSLIAIIQAVKARKIIRQSNGEIRGSGKVMWCFIVGGAGLLFWGYVILMVVINVATT
jgi:hypothetical protein